MKKYFLGATIFVFSMVILVVVVSHYFPQYSQYKLSPKPISVPGGVSDLGPSSVNDPAFYDLAYKMTSSLPIAPFEKTVTYTYPYNPCGTLMTQFSQIGSVRVGRGPVYEMAASQCAVDGKDLVPNDFSFRVYSCKNIQSNDSVGGVVGQATFAFQCSKPTDANKCVQARIDGTTLKADWNCGSI